MDVLLARQYNLISCLLEQGNKRGSGGSAAAGAAAGSGDRRPRAGTPGRLMHALLQDTPDTALGEFGYTFCWSG